MFFLKSFLRERFGGRASTGRLVAASLVLAGQILLITLVTSGLSTAWASAGDSAVEISEPPTTQPALEQAPALAPEPTSAPAPEPSFSIEPAGIPPRRGLTPARTLVPKPPKAKARVTQVDYVVEQLLLAVNQSLVIDLPMPIKRAAVASEEIAAVAVVSPKQVLVTGKSFGFTQLVLWDQDGAQRVFDVRVDIDVTRLTRILEDAAPRAQIQVKTILDSVVLAGTVPDAVVAERLLELAKVFSGKVKNQLSVAGAQQVLLRTKVAEISREAIRSLGLNGTFFGAKAFGGSNLSLINPTSIGLRENSLVPVPVPNQFQIIPGDLGVSPTTTLYFGLPRAQLELFLQAMSANSLIRVLAEPNLVAISGQEATFLAGGEIPIPTPSEDGIAITFKKFGVQLIFTPVVQAGQTIRVKVNSIVSEPDFTNAVQIAGLVIPGFATRRADTTVELGSGQTFAIAGLLSDNLRGIIEKVPGAGDIPVLGALFRSVRYERAETELLVMVTPELVQPINPQQASYYPGHDVATPNDWQLYGLGMNQDDTFEPEVPEVQQSPTKPSAPLLGPWGFEQTSALQK